MALASAVAALQLLARKGARLRVLIVSDSQYLVKGMREWVPGWVGRGMEAEGGPDREPRALEGAGRERAGCTTCSGPGSAGTRVTPKNEYANDLAVRAAQEQRTSDGIVESGFDEWLAAKQAKGLYLAYDPDAAFAELEERLLSDEPFALSGVSR